MTSMLPTVADAPVIAVEGRLDPETVDALERRIVAALDTGQSRIVVDLRAVTWLPLPVVSRFCAALRRVSRRAAAVALAGGHPHVRRAVELCAIDRVELEPPSPQ